MATGNFAYENRCIVVTDNDYENGNIPPLGDWEENTSRSYPSRLLAVSDDFKFWNIVITTGYYSGACIDYKENDATIEDWLGATFYYATQKDFFNECHNEFGISYYRLKKVCGKVGAMDIDTYLENAYDKLTAYLREKEETKVNAYLDGVKKLYLYDEVTCIGRASNGEAFYKKVG